MLKKVYTAIEEPISDIYVAGLSVGEMTSLVSEMQGYPLADVEGFIRNAGQNCLLCGCWKVYSEPEHAQRTFAEYGRCREYLCDKLEQGVDLYQALQFQEVFS